MLLGTLASRAHGMVQERYQMPTDSNRSTNRPQFGLPKLKDLLWIVLIHDYYGLCDVFCAPLPLSLQMPTGTTKSLNTWAPGPLPVADTFLRADVRRLRNTTGRRRRHRGYQPGPLQPSNRCDS